MLCREIMKSEVESFLTTDSAMEIARRMREVNIGFVPICDRDGHPLGAITDRDLALRVSAEDKKASRVHAGEIMTHETVTCRDADDVERAEELMAEHHKSRIMVVDSHDRLVGVISMSDLVSDEGDTRAVATLRRIAEREVHLH